MAVASHRLAVKTVSGVTKTASIMAVELCTGPHRNFRKLRRFWLHPTASHPIRKGNNDKGKSEVGYLTASRLITGTCNSSGSASSSRYESAFLLGRSGYTEDKRKNTDEIA